MKRRIIAFIALTLVLIGIALPALADGFTLETGMTISGMNLRSWAQGYQPTVSGDELTICLPISSDSTDERIKATLIMADETITPLKPHDDTDYFKLSKGIYPVRLKFKLHSARVNGDYAAIVRIEGADESNAHMTTDIPIVIRIRDGKSSGESLRPMIAAPECELRVGESAALQSTLRNPSRYAEMTDIQLTISDASGDILPSGTDKLSLPDLMPGESCGISYPLTALPSAKVSLHALSFKLTYKLLDQQCTWEENFSLPVSQQPRLEHGGVQMASTVIQGETAVLTLPLMNMGRGALRNVLVKLTLDGITDGQSVLVGSIETGGTQTAKLTFAAGKDVLGECRGTVTVQYEDEYGNAGSFQLPTAITVEEAVPLPAADAEDGEADEGAPRMSLVIAGGICLALLIALIVQGAVLRGKIRRLESEKL